MNAKTETELGSAPLAPLIAKYAVRSIVSMLVGAAFMIGAIFFAALQLFPREIISIFGTGSELYFEFAEKYLKIYMMFVFFQNIQPVTVTYFSATGNARQGLLVSLSRQGLFLIPLLIILPKFMGIHGTGQFPEIRF